MSGQPPDKSFHPETRAQWREWLQANYTRDEGVWLIRYKKAVGKSYVDYDESVEEALCFGWIDSLPRKLDSNWSALNKSRVEKIEIAKGNGSWDALNEVDALIIPDDLGEAFEQYPNPRENFEAFPPSTPRGILEWILNAKRPATRQKRIDETARLAAENIRANQWRK